MTCTCPSSDLMNHGIEYRDGQPPGEMLNNTYGYGPMRTGWSLIAGTSQSRLNEEITDVHFANIDYCPLCGGSLKERTEAHGPTGEKGP